ncbi:MAG: hypothetical protein Q7S11_00295 [bacterium]|nr:hypothetical protein [bacterium]
MPPEETVTPDALQPIVESPSPAVEVPTETPPPEPVQVAPEPSPAPVEAVPVPETAPVSAEATTGTQPTTPTGPQGPLPFSTTDDRQENQVAQIPPNEPIEPESDPIEPAAEKPTAAPEPPSAAASAPAPVIVQTGILHTAREFLGKARIAIQDRKRKKRDKIMAALNPKNKITTDEVEKLLHVSDATAPRYLSALVKEGKIQQVGKTGTGVTYSRAP